MSCGQRRSSLSSESVDLASADEMSLRAAQEHDGDRPETDSSQAVAAGVGNAGALQDRNALASENEVHDCDTSSRFQHTCDFAENLSPLIRGVDLVDQIVGEHDVEGLVGERQLADRKSV